MTIYEDKTLNKSRTYTGDTVMFPQKPLNYGKVRVKNQKKGVGFSVPPSPIRLRSLVIPLFSLQKHKKVDIVLSRMKFPFFFRVWLKRKERSVDLCILCIIPYFRKTYVICVSVSSPVVDTKNWKHFWEWIISPNF